MEQPQKLEKGAKITVKHFLNKKLKGMQYDGDGPIFYPLYFRITHKRNSRVIRSAIFEHINEDDHLNIFNCAGYLSEDQFGADYIKEYLKKETCSIKNTAIYLSKQVREDQSIFDLYDNEVYAQGTASAIWTIGKQVLSMFKETCSFNLKEFAPMIDDSSDLISYGDILFKVVNEDYLKKIDSIYPDLRMAYDLVKKLEPHGYLPTAEFLNLKPNDKLLVKVSKEYWSRVRIIVTKRIGAFKYHAK